MTPTAQTNPSIPLIGFYPLDPEALPDPLLHIILACLKEDPQDVRVFASLNRRCRKIVYPSLETLHSSLNKIGTIQPTDFSLNRDPSCPCEVKLGLRKNILFYASGTEAGRFNLFTEEHTAVAFPEVMEVSHIHPLSSSKLLVSGGQKISLVLSLGKTSDIFQLIEFEGIGESTIHSLPNSRGYFAGMVADSSILTIYDPNNLSRPQKISLQNTPEIDFTGVDHESVSLALSDRFVYVATTSWDANPTHIIQSYERSHGTMLYRILSSSPHKMLLVDNALVIGCKDGSYEVLDPTTLTPQHIHLKPELEDTLTLFQCHNGELYLGFASGCLEIRDLTSTTTGVSIEGFETIDCLEVFQDYIAIGRRSRCGKSGDLEIWHRTTLSLLHIECFEAPLTGLKLDSNYLIIGLNNGSVKMWPLSGVQDRFSVQVEGGIPLPSEVPHPGKRKSALSD